MNAPIGATERIDAPRAYGTPRRRTPIVRMLVLGLLAAALIAWAAQWVSTAIAFVHETDARIAADMVAVSSRTSGWLVERPVDAGAKVGAGEVIARIDARDAETRLAELHAEFERLEGERAEIGAEIGLVEALTRSRAEGERAKLGAAGALVEAIAHERDYLEREYRRAEKLSKSGMVSATALDASRTAYLKAQKELTRVRAEVATARAHLAEVEAEGHQTDVLERRRATLELRKAELMTRVDRQKIEIADRVIASPVDGVVSKAFVEVGEYVQPGQRIVLLHNPDAIYVEANVRETEIRRVAVGQAVRIEVDAYPDRRFEGRVALIGQAATSEFALLPNPNPSGHFTKVTQRLPVRVSLDQNDGLLRPGMMVEVFIDVGHD